MKKFSNGFLALILILLVFSLEKSTAFAQNKPTESAQYSEVSIQIYNAAVELERKRKYSLAEKTYNRVLTMQPNFIEAKIGLSNMYQDLANRYYCQGEYKHGIYYAKKSLDYDSKNIDTYQVLALCYLESNDNENLILTYNKILVIYPKDESTMNELASAYIKTNQFGKATEICNKILFLDPGNEKAIKKIKYIKSLPVTAQDLNK